MRGDIVARLPQDADKVLHLSNSHSCRAGDLTVCESCDVEPAATALVIQGETDSFGWEPMAFCQQCYDSMLAEAEAYEDALDVEDRAPKPGHLFLVSECTNNDGHGSWEAYFDSYREAAAFLRDIEVQAEPWCGLYPGNGVQEVPAAEAHRVVASAQAARRAEWEEWESEAREAEETARYA